MLLRSVAGPRICLMFDHSHSAPRQVLDSEEEEELTQTQDEQEGDDGGHFDVIPLYSERATISNLGSSGTGGSTSLVTGPPKSMLLLLVFLSASVSWG